MIFVKHIFSFSPDLVINTNILVIAETAAVSQFHLIVMSFFFLPVQYEKHQFSQHSSRNDILSPVPERCGCDGVHTSCLFIILTSCSYRDNYRHAPVWRTFRWTTLIEPRFESTTSGSVLINVSSSPCFTGAGSDLYARRYAFYQPDMNSARLSIRFVFLPPSPRL